MENEISKVTTIIMILAMLAIYKARPQQRDKYSLYCVNRLRWDLWFIVLNREDMKLKGVDLSNPLALPDFQF